MSASATWGARECPPGGWWEDEHDFAPLRAYLREHPNVEALPWEYMGSVPGGTLYRERETGLRLLLGRNGVPWGQP